MSKHWSLLCLLLILQSCGFRLAGSAALPDYLHHIHLQTQGLTNDLLLRLSRHLQQAGATVYPSADAQSVLLVVTLESLPDRTLVDSMGSGQTVIRIRRQLSFNLINAKGEILVKQKSLSQKLDLELDDNNLLGVEGERRDAQKSLDVLLIDGLIRQLRRL